MNIKEIYNLSIIGLGSVGLRHLESLFKLDLDMNIYLIDIDDNYRNIQHVPIYYLAHYIVIFLFSHCIYQDVDLSY